MDQLDIENIHLSLSNKEEKNSPPVDFTASFAESIEHLVPKGAHRYAIALSGGLDSCALTLLLNEYTAENGGEIVAALTVDHGLRKESASEARDMARAMGELAIHHQTLVWEGEKPHSNIQSSAREARYKLLADWCLAHNIDYLCTAHHMNDQAETVIMRMMRGSGVDGLSSIAPTQTLHGVKILRPLLVFSRTDLGNFMRDNTLKWIEDPSNKDTRYLRARVRDYILTSASMFDISEEQLISRLADVATNMQRARDYFESTVNDFMDQHTVLHPLAYLSIDTEAFCNLHSEIGLRVLAHSLKIISGVNKAQRFDSLSPLYKNLINRNYSKPATLHGCMIRPHSTGHIDILREPNAVKEVIDIHSSYTARWDNRFICTIDLAEHGDYQLKSLGPEGLRYIRDALREPIKDISIPQRAYHSLPSLWKNDIPVYVPHVDYCDRELIGSIDMEAKFILTSKTGFEEDDAI